MVSLVMLADSALSTAARRRGLAAGSATPARVATVISRISLVNTLARLASSAFLRPSMDGPLPMAGKPEQWTSGRFYSNPGRRRQTADAMSRASLHAARSALAGREAAMLQKMHHLLCRIGGQQQAGVAGFDHAMVGKPRQLRLGHRHGAIVFAVHLRQHGAQANRHAPGDHADLTDTI